MSACDRVQPLLAESISGELDPGEAAEVRAHLAECASCRAEEVEMRGLLELLARDAADGLGSGVRDPGSAYWAGFADRVAANASTSQSGASANAPHAKSNVVWLFGPLPRLVAAGLAAAAVLVVALKVPTVPTAVSAEDPHLAELLTESIASQPLIDLSDLEADDLDRLGEELVTTAAAPTREVDAPRSPASTLDGLEDLSTTELEKLLEQLDAFET